MIPFDNCNCYCSNVHIFSCHYFDDVIKRKILLVSIATITLTFVTNLKKLKPILLPEDFLNGGLRTTLCRCLLVMLLRSSFFSSDSLSFTEATVCIHSSKWVFLKISQYSQEHICVGFSFSIKWQVLGLPLYKKETPTQVFSYEYCEIFKNSFFL